MFLVQKLARARLAVAVVGALSGAVAVVGAEKSLERDFTAKVHPFVETYCLDCHDKETRKADLDLSGFTTFDSVARDGARWELVLERLRNADMPPKKARQQPTTEARKEIAGWIEAMRDREARRTAGDPGPVLPRRLSNAEYDYTIRDLTGVDLRPTREFPVDPANQAGFDNSGESLAMSPALVKKYLQAAREVADHLVLQPEGFTFAPHPVLVETDRDKWSVFRIVNFYRQQPTDYADYFMAAWSYRYRVQLGRKGESLPQVAARSRVSAKYLATIWFALNEPTGGVGPIAKLQAMWRALPAGGPSVTNEVRKGCEAMRDYVTRLRAEIVPEVKNLSASPIAEGSQPVVLWKDREMAANRRRYNPAALKSASGLTNAPGMMATNAMAFAPTNKPARKRRVQAPTPEVVQKGGFSLPPAIVTRETSATAKMAAAKKLGPDADLIVPDDPAEHALYAAAFARFADIFPDAFYITERARVFLDATQEQGNAGRLLSAGFHNMTGYFRDDRPLYDLILDDAGQKQLDRLWDEFDLVASVPQRMYMGFMWSERVDSTYMLDKEFAPFRSEDKSVCSPEKIQALATLYLAKARRNNVSEIAQQAVVDHFNIVATNLAHVEQLRVASEPTHLKTLETFAQRAYRRPLTSAEREDLRAFYQACRKENGLDHEDAMRDCVARVLVSPKFLFRLDLADTTNPASAPATGSKKSAPTDRVESDPLSDYALASRLSYFLWSSMPDNELLAHAAAGDLHQPKVLRAQAARMLKDARLRNFATEFAGNWLDFRRFEQLNSVDRDRFPAFNNDLRAAMFEEPLRFFQDVAQRDRPVLDLLYGRDTYVNGPLAKHYGITPGPPGTNTWVHVENAREWGRGGLLPMAAFLTANSPGLRTSPVKRGNWVVKRVLGERIPPPPAVVPELPKDEKAMGALTVRDLLAQHRNRAGCMECHARFDSFGLVFESFGPVGERRQMDLGGRPVDTRAEFPGGGEGDGLDGLVQYIHARREGDFVNNLCRKLLAYGLGRTLILGDEPLVRQMRDRLAADKYRFGSLIESIVTSPQFLNIRRPGSLAKN